MSERKLTKTVISSKARNLIVLKIQALKISPYGRNDKKRGFRSGTKYIESKTGDTRYRTLKGEDFLHLIMQHVLPKGFRRVRDYGFLHSNAKKLLHLVQLILHVVIKGIEQRLRPVFKCPCCKSPMVILGFRRIAWGAG